MIKGSRRGGGRRQDDDENDNDGKIRLTKYCAHRALLPLRIFNP